MSCQTYERPTVSKPAIIEQLYSEGSHQLPRLLSQCPQHPFLPLTEINLNQIDNVLQCSKCSFGQNKLLNIFEILYSPDDFILSNWPKMDSINKELQQVLQRPSESTKIQQKKQSNNMTYSKRNQDKMRDLFVNLRENILSTLATKEEECMKIAEQLDSSNFNEEASEYLRQSTIDLYLKLSSKYELKEEFLKEHQSLQDLQNSIKIIIDKINGSSFSDFQVLDNHLFGIKTKIDPLFQLFKNVKQEINCLFISIEQKAFPNSSPFLINQSQSSWLPPPIQFPKSQFDSNIFNMQSRPNIFNTPPIQSNLTISPLSQQLNLNPFNSHLEHNLKSNNLIAQFPQYQPINIDQQNLNPIKQFERLSPIYLIDPKIPLYDDGYEFEILPPAPVLSNPKERQSESQYNIE